MTGQDTALILFLKKWIWKFGEGLEEPSSAQGGKFIATYPVHTIYTISTVQNGSIPSCLSGSVKGLWDPSGTSCSKEGARGSSNNNIPPIIFKSLLQRKLIEIIDESHYHCVWSSKYFLVNSLAFSGNIFKLLFVSPKCSLFQSPLDLSSAQFSLWLKLELEATSIACDQLNTWTPI